MRCADSSEKKGVSIASYAYHRTIVCSEAKQ
jgi:hypothetical protein